VRSAALSGLALSPHTLTPIQTLCRRRLSSALPAAVSGVVIAAGVGYGLRVACARAAAAFADAVASFALAPPHAA
jgi:hypothetical protein